MLKAVRRAGARNPAKPVSWSSACARDFRLPGCCALRRATQLDNRARRQPQRCPPRDRPGTLPCLPIVGDPGEPSAQLDRSGKLATLVESGADRRQLFLGHSKHPPSMEMLAANGKLIFGGQPDRCTRFSSPCTSFVTVARSRAPILVFTIVCERRPAQSASESESPLTAHTRCRARWHGGLPFLLS